MRRTSGEGSFTGDPGRYVNKAPDMGISRHSGPFVYKRNLESGGGACIPGTLN